MNLYTKENGKAVKRSIMNILELISAQARVNIALEEALGALQLAFRIAGDFDPESAEKTIEEAPPHLRLKANQLADQSDKLMHSIMDQF